MSREKCGLTSVMINLSRENERLAQRLNQVRFDFTLSHQTWSYKTVDKLCCLANFKSKAFEKSGSA